MAATETTPLLKPGWPSQSAPSPAPKNSRPTEDEEAVGLQPKDECPEHQDVPANLRLVLPILFIGVFVSNLEGSLIIATHGIIASEFDSFRYSEWLVASYTLALCATEPLVGKLSDIYGRKRILVLAYAIFALSCAICGLGSSFWMVILGRVIGGVGGSGMFTTVTLIITDLVPLRKFATYRGYISLAITMGRLLGGPLGGFLADSIGWRWVFLAQCPAIIIVLCIVIWGVPSPTTQYHSDTGKAQNKLARIDFLGGALLASTIVSLLSAMHLFSQDMSLKHPLVFILALLSAMLGSSFLVVEKYWAVEPVFPLHLLANRNVVASYLTSALTAMAQISLMFTVPIYFQISASAPAAIAGAHLLPLVGANAIGSILTGMIIDKTGNYRLLLFLGSFLSAAACILVAVRWRGDTGLLESLYLIPLGLGTATTHSTAFIALTAGVVSADIAVATTGLFLSLGVGQVLGLVASKAIVQGRLVGLLEKGLRDVVEAPGRAEIITKVLTDINFIESLAGRLREVVVRCYVESLMWTYVFALVCVALTVALACLVRVYKL